MAMTIKLRQQVPQHLHLLLQQHQLCKNSQLLVQHLLRLHQQRPLQQSITIYQQHNENKQLSQQHLFNSLFKVGKVKISMCQQYNENKQLKQLKQQAPLLQQHDQLQQPQWPLQRRLHNQPYRLHHLGLCPEQSIA
jgi:hypothetical protein